MPIVLGIETSCDDTSLCLLQGQAGQWTEVPKILAFESYAQDLELRPFGGVVPEIASRYHVAKLSELLPIVFDKAKIKLSDVDLIAVTTRPGLIGPLLTGITTAKTLALWQEKPIIGIHHLQAHLEAIHLMAPHPYPYLGLLVSGGHSAYYLVSGPENFEMIGTTTDDAAGEAFDKGGKLLGLGYPAGKLIDELAAQGASDRFHFPIGLKTDKSCNLSFSGLKTSLRNFIEEHGQDFMAQKDQSAGQGLKDVCASYQHAIVSALALKLDNARNMVGRNLPIVVGGGVACNSGLRKKLKELGPQISFVPPQYCTDNGAMVAGLGLRLLSKATAFPDCLGLGPQSQVIVRGKGI